MRKPPNPTLAPGLTLRDLYAMAALSGVMAGRVAAAADDPDPADLIADSCFEIADAMLESRMETDV